MSYAIKTKIIFVLVNIFLVCGFLVGYSCAAEISKKELFKTEHFSIYVDTDKWKFIKQNEQNPEDDDIYVKTDLGNALSNPIIGEGSERVLYMSEEELDFTNKREKIDLSVSYWPLALWEITGRNQKEVADSVRDAALLITHGDIIDIKNSDIKYFEKVVNNKHFFCASYVFDEMSVLGVPVHATHIICCYLPDSLKERYWFTVSHYDNNKAIDVSVLLEVLTDFLNGFETVPVNKKQECLDYTIYSAKSLYMAFRQRIFFDTKDKQPLSIYKVPVNIEQDGVIKRRILKSDILDIRQHPIQERIDQTVALLKKTVKKYPAEPLIYFGLGLLYEFNMFGERYGEGFKEDLTMAAYQDALSVNQEFTPARYNLAVLYLRKGDLDKGIEELKKITVDKKDNEWEAYCAFAYAYEKKNDFVAAVKYYKLTLANLTAKNKRAAPGLINQIKERIKLLSR